jgi:hypothetical protein
MAFTTRVQWDDDKVTHADRATRGARLDTLREQGLLIGDWTFVDGNIGIRNWATLEAAQDWVSYVNTFTPPPLLAEVVTTE